MVRTALVGRGSAAIGRDTRALDSAETWLGDDHNLVVLHAQLSKDTSVLRSALDMRRLERAVGASQRRLRRQAIARTRSIFAATSRDYVRRVKRAWKARRRPVVRR